MAFKHQSDCYRTISGARFINWCDLLDQEHEEQVALAKRLGIRHRVIKTTDGTRRLFIEESAVDRLAAS